MNKIFFYGIGLDVVIVLGKLAFCRPAELLSSILFETLKLFNEVLLNSVENQLANSKEMS